MVDEVIRYALEVHEERNKVDEEYRRDTCGEIVEEFGGLLSREAVTRHSTRSPEIAGRPKLSPSKVPALDKFDPF